MTITSIARLAVKGGKQVGKLIKNGKVTKWIKENPKTAAGIFGAGGLTAAAIIKAATSSKKEQYDYMKRFFGLSNPFVNPIGCWDAMINKRTTVNELDNPLLKYWCDRIDKNYQKYYDNLSPQEKVREFYKNGGKGLNFTKNE